jgi:hypothetical protein
MILNHFYNEVSDIGCHEAKKDTQGGIQGEIKKIAITKQTYVFAREG